MADTVRSDAAAAGGKRADMSQANLAEFIRDIPDFPKPGILFRDISPLLNDPAAMAEAVRRMAEPFRCEGIEAVAAVEARGFLFGAPLALELDCALVPVRKKGKLPAKTISYTYDLEYGSDTLEVHEDAFAKQAKVLIVDDVLATGGTVQASCQLIEKAGGVVAGCVFLIELVGLGGVAKIDGYHRHTLIQYD